jgi:hypothetical protein
MVQLSILDIAAESCVSERLSLIESGKQTRDDILAKLLDTERVKGENVNFNLRDVKVEVYSALCVFLGDREVIVYRVLTHFLDLPAVIQHQSASPLSFII